MAKKTTSIKQKTANKKNIVQHELNQNFIRCPQNNCK